MRDLNELQRLAEQGHDESQFLLGYNYSRGQAKDINKAKLWLERAAMANNPRAQYYLGELCAELGRGDPRGAYSHMAFWWGKSSSHPYWETMEGMDGRAVSKRRLVWLHMHSGFEAANPEEAMHLLGELANKYSSPRSAIELGIVYAAGSFAPLSKRLGNAPIQRDAENGFRLIERGLKIIENGNNDIDYNLYNVIADVYLERDGNNPRTPDTIQMGIHYKKKALERATGFNEGIALNIQNELSVLENELRQFSASPQPTIPTHEPDEAPRIPPSTQNQNRELAEKFERFHAYFDTLDMNGKKDFISSLDQKLQANPNPDYQVFLLECVEKYRIANKEERAAEAFPGSFDSGRQDHPVDTSRSDFMQSTGAYGQTYDDERPEPYPQPDYNQTTFQPAEMYPQGEYSPDNYGVSQDGTYDGTAYQHSNIGDYDSASYTDRIHSYGASAPFLFGTILYTLGGLMLPVCLWLLSAHPLFTDTPRRMLGYGLMVVVTILPLLPIVALWMIYSASKSPRAPEKSLTSLTMFRITFFLHLSVIMAGAGLLALLFGADGQALFGLSIFDSPLDLVLILGALALIVLYVTFFYGSLFSMIKGIRDGIYSNLFDALPGVGPFSFISYVTSTLMILAALAIILVGVAPIEILPIEIPMLDTINNYAEHWFGYSGSMALALMAFAFILSRAGALLCTNVVNQFNSGLGDDEE